jgi:hypothetical protein
MSMSWTAASLGGTYHDMRHDLMLTTARQGKQRRGRGQLPGLRSPDHVDTQPQVRVRVRRIHPAQASSLTLRSRSAAVSRAISSSEVNLPPPR